VCKETGNRLRRVFFYAGLAPFAGMTSRIGRFAKVLRINLFCLIRKNICACCTENIGDTVFAEPSKNKL
jgi:hypothetical protein